MIDELRAVAIFVEVVRNGSFRAAAKRLNLSPSAVSYNVAQMEKRIGNALLYRSTRRLSLTREGEYLFEHASDLLSGVTASLEKIAGNQSILPGRLIVSATTALLRSTLNQKISQYCTDNPHIDFEIHYTDERQDIIRSGIDVAIRAGDMPDSALKSKLVTRIERKLVCSQYYFATQKVPRTPKDLQHWKWIKLAMMPDERILRKAGESCEAYGSYSQLTVNSVDAMVQFCTQNMGLATPPTFLVEDQLKQGSLVEVLPRWRVDPIPIYAVWPGNHVKNKNAHKFIELVKDIH
jgi:DNA-binding transcriptional LysR family regulator